MMDTIDQIARIVGYCTIGYGVLKFANMILKDREAERAARDDRAYLESLRVNHPSKYEHEMWWRNNMDRKRHGIPTDPEFDEQAKRMVESVRDTGLL